MERSIHNIVYSMVSLGTKIGIAGGGSIAVAVLGTIGFVANQEPTAQVLTRINMLTNLGPIVFIALAMLFLTLTDITDEEAAKNREILEQREV